MTGNARKALVVVRRRRGHGVCVRAAAGVRLCACVGMLTVKYDASVWHVTWTVLKLDIPWSSRCAAVFYCSVLQYK